MGAASGRSRRVRDDQRLVAAAAAEALAGLVGAGLLGPTAAAALEADVPFLLFRAAEVAERVGRAARVGTLVVRRGRVPGPRQTADDPDDQDNELHQQEHGHV